MNNIKYIGLSGAVLLSGAAQAMDWSDWEVRPRIGTGLMQYKYEQAPQAQLIRDGTLREGVGVGGLKVEDSLLFAEFGVSMFLGNFFIDLSFQKSEAGDDSASLDYFDASVLDSTTLFIAADQSGNVEVDRQELTLSIGYAMSDRLGVFAGYKKNETTLDQDFSGQLYLALAGENPQSFESFDQSEFQIVSNISSDFDQDGLFLGATYVWPFESDGWLNGALSFDLGIAFLDGEFSSRGDRIVVFEGVEEAVPPSNLRSDADGSAVGLNLGVAWSGPLFDRFNYSVGVDGYQYNYGGGGDSADFDDTLIRFSLGVSYAFESN